VPYLCRSTITISCPDFSETLTFKTTYSNITRANALKTAFTNSGTAAGSMQTFRTASSLAYTGTASTGNGESRETTWDGGVADVFADGASLTVEKGLSRTLTQKGATGTLEPGETAECFFVYGSVTMKVDYTATAVFLFDKDGATSWTVSIPGQVRRSGSALHRCCRYPIRAAFPTFISFCRAQYEVGDYSSIESAITVYDAGGECECRAGQSPCVLAGASKGDATTALRVIFTVTVTGPRCSHRHTVDGAQQDLRPGHQHAAPAGARRGAQLLQLQQPAVEAAERHRQARQKAFQELQQRGLQLQQCQAQGAAPAAAHHQADQGPAA
jgi:hypothetical protein